MKNIKSYRELVLEEISSDDQEELDWSLIAAVQDGAADEVESLLSAGASPNAIDSDDEWNPIHYAARDGYKEIVELLLDRGSDVDPKTTSGSTPLSLAAGSGFSGIVELLIDHGASIDTVDRLGRKPIHRAKNVDVLKLLLERGADVDEETVSDPPRTPLYYAVMLGMPTLAKFLIQKGADPLKAFARLNQMLEFFRGDVSWIPEGELKAKLHRMQRGKGAFGM